MDLWITGALAAAAAVVVVGNVRDQLRWIRLIVRRRKHEMMDEMAKR